MLLRDISFASYTRTTNGYGTIQLGIPYDDYLKAMPTLFQPDWRVDVWRSADDGIPKRREGSFFLRKFNIYHRQQDNVRMIEFFGRSPLDILRRFSVTSTAFSSSTQAIDDMMKDIVTNWVVASQTYFAPQSGEWSVDGKLGLGPSITQKFLGKTVLDILKDLKATSFTKNKTLSTNRKIYFDVVEGPGLSGGFGYIFRTYADLRGIDRRQGLVFSAENGNLQAPAYYEDYLDEVTSAFVANSVPATASVDHPDVYLSRWNRIVEYNGTYETDTNAMAATANQMVTDGEAQRMFNGTFLNTPGSPTQPRSLYGIDWDMGDLLPCQFAEKNFNAEVVIVYVSVNDKGQENVTGASTVGSGQVSV